MMAAEGKSLRHIVVRETFWNTAGAYSGMLLNVGVTAILARLLSPAEFGLVATVLTFTLFFDTLAELALVGAVVQRADASEGELSAVFWLMVSGATAVYILLFGVVSLLAPVFGTAEFATVMRVLGLNVFMAALLVVPSAILRQRLELRPLSISRLASVVVGAAVAVAMALGRYGYWALVGQSIATYATQVVAVFWFSRWRPRLTFSAEVAAPIGRFAGAVSLHAVINYWARNAGNLLIARFAGIGALGEFNLAQRLVGIPIQLLWSALGPMLHPTYAIIGDDLPRLRSAYASFAQLTAIVSFSIAAVLGLTVDHLVAILWGPKWTAAVGLVYALLPVAAVQPVNAVGGPLFLARDRTGLMVRVGALNAVFLLAGMLLGLRWGAAGVAWGYSLAYVCFAATSSTLIVQSRVLRGTTRELVAWLWRPLAIAGAVLATGGAARLLTLSAAPFVILVVVSAASLLGFLAALRTIAWPLVLSVLRARRGGPAAAPPAADA